jgi:p-hydroxybenzoate 3-monooxygenase
LSNDRIWTGLHSRLDSDGFSVSEGKITKKSITPMRSFVTAPMRHGRLLLVGNAAHIVPAPGAEGLKVAVADATVVAEAISAHYDLGDDSQLAIHSERPRSCLVSPTLLAVDDHDAPRRPLSRRRR